MWYTTESDVKPELHDTTSSGVYNYARRNIHQEERESQNGETYSIWVYEECKVVKSDWWLFLENLRNTSNIEFLSMMTGVDLDA